MYKRFLQPPALLFFTALIILLAYFIPTDASIDIHLHDIYIIISYPTISFVAGSILFYESVIYFATRKFRQFRSLQYIHVGSIFFFIIAYFCYSRFPTQQPELMQDFNSFMRIRPREWIVIFTFLLLLLGQLLFLLNIILGFFRGKKSSTGHNNAL